MSSAKHEPPLARAVPESSPVRLMARLSSLVWWLLLALLLLFALYAGIGRQLTRNIDAFTDELAYELSTRTGQSVTIGSLESSWIWLDPSFIARDISVSNPETGIPVADVEYLRVRFDFLSSLLRLRVVFEDFEVDGLQLTLNQSAAGEVGVRGADLPEPAHNRMQRWLSLAGEWLSDPYLKITRFNLGIRDSKGGFRHVDIPQLDLVYSQGLFRASGRAMQPGTTQQLASFSLVGQRFFRGDFTGQLYIGVDSGRLFDGLIDEYQWKTVRVEGFDLGGEAWLTFREGTLQQVTGTVKTPYLQLGVGSESLAPLEDIQARFGWRRHADVLSEQEGTETVGQPPENGPGEWHLQDLQWTWDGEDVPAFSLRLMPGANGLTAIADALPLDPLRRLVSLLPVLPDKAASALVSYQPGGFIDRLELNLPDNPSEGFNLSGELREVSVAAHQGAPGATGINGFLYLDRHSGFVRIENAEQPVNLGFPLLFSNNWSLSGAEGLVAWELDGPVTRVYADNLRMTYGENTVLNGGFDLRLDKEGEDNLGLRVGVENGRADMLAEFVPAKVVKPELYDWLTTAILQADITSGVFYGHGQIDRGAPRHSFSTSMKFEFQNAAVAYDERWPEVTGASGQVVVDNGNTRVDLDAADTGGLSLSPSLVRLVPGADGATILVDANATVPGEAVAYWMENSPLGDMAGTEAAKLQYEGEYGLNLGIELPLGKESGPIVEAKVSAQGGSITYPPANLSWHEIAGELTYHSVDGFSGGPVNARFFDSPVEIQLGKSPGGDALSVRQSGVLSLPDLLSDIGAAAGQGFGLEGRVSYTATLDVGVDSTSGIRARSDLVGLSVDWPEPLGKPAEEAAPLDIVLDPRGAAGMAVSGQWENRLAFDLLWKDTGFELDFSHLYLGRHALRDIRVEALDLGDRWVVSTESERAKGRVVLPGDDSPVVADFETIRLVRAEDSAKASQRLTLEEQLETFRELDLGRWPDVNVTIADLQLNEDTLGSWSFKLRPTPDRLSVDEIEGRLSSLTLLGDMIWGVQGGREISRFNGSVTGGALADINELLGSDIPLTNNATNIELAIDWPGRPDELSLSELNGSVSLRLDEGVILEQNNTAQLFRIFNLLNADTLWRRLKLDFSDLYERGVAFDAISGKANIRNGLVSLDPEVQVVGPSGAFKLSGVTDISTETLDMRLVVVLPLTQNLPLAALLMGAGAPIGGALFVLDKILGDPLSRLTSATYSVTGSWDDPLVDLKRVFDTGE
ncbi:hypothetical protein FWJ25_04260 [Marinobacter salinexigens]|uniref:YhdP central domain-containing protein n=1 Tax=Marinobacter salinexigens TaxID=2919747 RepID=A0A5B0VR06_9GAMM|nr:AsmA-like C-terminal region-containing protein [Marinobacter salinexigens]KAA1176351.1 hypothetical protein FWJ25_04260 [Marinobacter salinexigens]